MNKYQRGKVYKLISEQSDKVYVGSTCEPTLARRLATHRADYKYWLNGSRKGYVSSFEILQYDDCKIILIEDYPCENKDNLRSREQYWIEQTPNCCNKQNAFVVGSGYSNLTQKEYSKTYRDLRHEHNIEYEKNRYWNNREERLKQNKEWRDKNKDKIKALKSEKINCECGAIITRQKKSIHDKTQKHIDLINVVAIKQKNESIICECGGKYIKSSKSVHFKSKKHQDFINKDNN